MGHVYPPMAPIVAPVSAKRGYETSGLSPRPHRKAPRVGSGGSTSHNISAANYPGQLMNSQQLGVTMHDSTIPPERQVGFN